MTDQRILGLVKSCGMCPHRRSHGSGSLYCGEVNEPISNKEQVAGFCPLPLYPASKIAGLERQISVQSVTSDSFFHPLLLTHLVRRLGLDMPSVGYNLKLRLNEDDRQIYLDFDYIHKIELFQGLSIRFEHQGIVYVLEPEGNAPSLREIVPNDGGEEASIRLNLK